MIVVDLSDDVNKKWLHVDLEDIEDVDNANPHHGPDGKFTFAPGSSGGGRGKGGSSSSSGDESDQIGSDGKDLLGDNAGLDEFRKLPNEYFDGAWISGKGDWALHEIYRAQGYDAKPKVVADVDVKKYAKDNGTPELYRGVTEKVFKDDFKNSSIHYPGEGVTGNGTYATTKKIYALEYTEAVAGDDTTKQSSNIIHMTLSKNAKIGDFKKIQAERGELINRLLNEGMGDYGERMKYIEPMHDVGKYAALRGYDALKIVDTGTYVVYNRGKVIMGDE